MNLFKPTILPHERDIENMSSSLGLKFKTSYNGYCGVLHLKDSESNDYILKMAHMPNDSSWISDLGNCAQLSREYKALFTLKDSGMNIPRVLQKGKYSCEQSNDAYTYILKEFIPGYSHKRDDTLTDDQKSQLEGLVRDFHINGFANLDLYPWREETNVLIGEDNGVWMVDLGLVQRKGKSFGFKKAVDKDLRNLEEFYLEKP